MPVFHWSGYPDFTVVVSLDVFGSVYKTIGEALRYGAFQVVSIVTTTGYATADYEQWPAMSQLILLLCMFLGASAGSTGGGMKCLRIMLCFKYCYKELFLLIHPHAVSHVKIAGKPVPDDVMRSVLGFLALYVGLVCPECDFAGRSGSRFYHFFWRRGGHHRKYRARIRHGRTGGKLCSDTLSGKMVADLVHVAGQAGNIYRDYPGCSGVLAKIIKNYSLFFIDFYKKWN